EGGLIQDCENLLGMTATEISGDAALLKRFTTDINTYYKRANSWIWESTGTWEYDDSNYTDMPIATTTLVADQQDYEIPSTAQKIDRVEVLDSAGNYQRIKPIDKSEITSQSMSEFLKTAGMPVYYDLVGRSILLYPKPATASVTTTKGLKLYFSRNIVAFGTSDTTTAPGFVNNFHRLLSLGASYDYCISFEIGEKANFLKGQLNEMKDELKNFYGSRHRDMKTRIKPKRRNYA
ncbi:MAG: phage adaptor protein, partial [Candidatus Heimdallarchaeaceae archaeon]